MARNRAITFSPRLDTAVYMTKLQYAKYWRKAESVKQPNRQNRLLWKAMSKAGDRVGKSRSLFFDKAAKLGGIETVWPRRR